MSGQNFNIEATPRVRLAELIAEQTRKNDYFISDIPGLTLVKYESVTPPVSAIYEPSICLVAQGAKKVLLGDEEYIYDEGNALITTVGLPVVAAVTEASIEKPLLSVILKLDLRLIAQLMIESGIPSTNSIQPDLGIALNSVSDELLNCFERLIVLQNSPADVPVLAPLIIKEIMYRLLISEFGPSLRQIAATGSHGQQIAKSINWLKENFTSQIRIEHLANMTGMSISTFHHHFRMVTAMSPLQFQKWLRLHEARRLMLVEHKDASSAAVKVGYESPSQFNREYKRQFGAPPLRDIKQLHKNGQTEVVTRAD